MNSEKERKLVGHGRYYAEFATDVSGGSTLEGIQEVLDRGSDRGWHLVGVAGHTRDLEVILFWDTEVANFPNYGRRDQ